ncbi:MAG: M20/M25/M40 family metallo-hydrolase [Bacteroidales bacterium]|nr:M20/M25/M40 family metallo-hydrolase [Bacteroidales bacterium]
MMSYSKLFFLLLLSFSGIRISFAQDISDIEKHLRQDIGALAHDSMFGREAGTPYELVAATYIAESFQKSGLVPYHSIDGTYLKKFNFQNYQFQEGKLAINGIQYKSGVDFGAVAGSADGEINEVEIYDSESTDLKDATGKAILFDLKGRKKMSQKAIRQKLDSVESIAGQGVAAIILYNGKNSEFRNLLFFADSTSDYKVPVVYVSMNLANQIKKLDHPKATLLVKINRTRPAAYNVAGYLNKGMAKTIIVGAHYDHVGTPGVKDPKVGEPRIHNGADDNASGTAAIMELARWASVQPDLKYNVLFIAFGAEEKGLIGSKNFCNSPDFRKEEIAWMLNLDMVGRFNWNGKNNLFVLGLGSSRTWNKVLKSMGKGDFKFKKTKGAPAFSDHHPFLEKGIPVIYFTTGLHDDYHKPIDDAEWINYNGEAHIVDYLQTLILKMQSVPSPEFKKISFFHQVGAVFKIFIFK